MTVARLMLIVGLVVIVSGTCFAQEWTWYSPLNMTTADSRLVLENGEHPLTALRISTTEADDWQLVFLGLPLPGNAVMDSFRICYEVMSEGVCIGGIDVSKMTTPDAASLAFASSTDLCETEPTCFTMPAYNGVVNGCITMRLKLDFTSANGVVEIGAIGVHTVPAIVGVNDGPETDVPQMSALSQNYPNPFNPGTLISFDLLQSQHVSLEIYTLNGRRVRTLVESEMAAGKHELNWNGNDDNSRPLPSGVYIYRLIAGTINESRRMTLVR